MKRSENKLAEDNDRLRQQLDLYRQQEVERLTADVARLTVEVNHYRAEAERNAALGHLIARESEAERSVLVRKLDAVENFSNARQRTH